jgi:phosphatidylglycerol:prolipoprotein diacylglycerol transferase
VNTFTILFVAGASLGLWRLYQGVEKSERESRVIDSLWILLAALLGSRLAFVVAHASYFHDHVQDMLSFWKGGLAWPGAIIGAALAFLLIAYFRALKTTMLADQFAVLILPVSASIWLGGWFVGVAYGPQLPNGTWYGLSSVDAYGEISLRFPLQPLMTLLMLLFSAGIEHAWKTKLPGQYACSEMVLLTSLLLATSIFRTDPQQMWHDWPVEAWISALLLTASLTAIGLSFRQHADKDRQVR